MILSKEIHNNALFRFTTFFVCGDLLFLYLLQGLIPGSSGFLAFAGGFCCLFAVQFALKPHYSRRWLAGVLVYLAALLFGIGAGVWRGGIIRSDPALAKATTCAGFISEPVQPRKQSFRTLVQLGSIKGPEGWKAYHAKILAYFPSKDSLKIPKTGDPILIDLVPQPIPAPPNPGEFNFSHFMGLQGIRHQVFLKEESWIRQKGPPQSNLTTFSLRIRDYFLSVFKTYGFDKRQFALASALTIGYRDEIDPETNQAFQRSGAMHLLAVSGLHVGLLYMALEFLLGILGQTPATRLLRLFTILAILWIFAAITGFPASILRATVMVSFIAGGRSIGRQSSILTSLAFSALMLLLYDPNMILDAGFQLSFAAVLGIVILERDLQIPPARKLKAVGWVWGLVAASVAAQLGTLPLSLLHFQQFPVYFLLTNLLAIPLSTLILFLSIALFIFSPFPLVANPVANLTRLLTDWLVGGIHFVETLPGALIEPIRINTIVAALLTLLMVFVILFYQQRQKAFLFSSLGTIWLIALLISMDRIHNLGQNRLTVFHVKGATAIQMVFVNHHQLITDSSVLQDQGRYNFSLRPSLTLPGLPPLETRILETASKGSPWGDELPVHFSLGRQTLAIWSDYLAQRTSPLKVDYLLVTGQTRSTAQQILAVTSPRQIIVDGSVPGYQAKRLKEGFTIKNKPVWITREKGAFINTW